MCVVLRVNVEKGFRRLFAHPRTLVEPMCNNLEQEKNDDSPTNYSIVPFRAKKNFSRSPYENLLFLKYGRNRGKKVEL